MRSILIWTLITLLAVDCAAYVWGLRRWLVYLRAQRAPELSTEARAEVLITPEYRRLRAFAQWPVTLAAVLFIAMMMVGRM